MGQLIFYTGNVVTVVGAFMALFWVVTSKRRYWTRRRRGIISLVFIGTGIFMMVSASNMGAQVGDASAPSSAPTKTIQVGR